MGDRTPTPGADEGREGKEHGQAEPVAARSVMEEARALRGIGVFTTPTLLEAKLAMDLNRSYDRRRRIAGVSLIAAPVLFLARDAMESVGGLDFEWTLAGSLSMLLFIPAVLGVAHLLREGADRLGLLGASLGITGIVAGSGMMTLFRTSAVVEAGVDGVPADAMAKIFQSSSALWASIFLPGLCYPLGMLLLGVGLWRARVVAPWIALLVVLGAPLFPIGRILGIELASLVCSALWIAAFGSIGWLVLTRPLEWWEPRDGLRAVRA